MNRLHVYQFGKDKNGVSRKFHKVFSETERQQAIDELIQNNGGYSFGFVITDKQRNDRIKFNEFYNEAKRKGGATLFIEPTSVRQLVKCNVSLSYYQHTIEGRKA